jgi:hypothetical protein
MTSESTPKSRSLKASDYINGARVAPVRGR